MERSKPAAPPRRLRGRSRRLQDLPEIDVQGVMVPVATGAASRFLGLAWMDPGDDGTGLVIPNCRSVHTFGMRFPIDIHFLDGEGCVVKSVMRVGPRRFVCCRQSRAVLELQSPPE